MFLPQPDSNMLAVEKVFQSQELSRVLRLDIKGKQLTTPTYFPAISGAEFGSNLYELISLVLHTSYPRVLISAYDHSKINPSDRKKLVGEIANYIRTGGFVMIDSGVFESYWKDDKQWNFKSYVTALTKIDADFYFSYDILPGKQSDAEYFRSTVMYAAKSVKLKRKEYCIPIFHGSNPKKLLQLVQKVLREHPELCNIIAVPERECGSNMTERANTISKLRNLLKEHELEDSMLHILGCGNPISMATYAYCGADMFDSVDWNKILIEPVDLRVYDIAQVELLKCKCEICKKMRDKPLPRALLHNLLFYQNYVLQIQKMIRENTLRDFLIQFLGAENLGVVEKPDA